MAGFLLFYPGMRGIYRKIAILLALGALAVTGVARSAEARGGGAAAMAAAKAKLSRGAQIKLNRMKQKMALRTRGAQQQKSRRQLKLSKRKMMRAMSRRETGLRTSETDRVRSAFARDIDDPADHMQAPKASGSKNGVTQEELEVASLKQRKKMRLRAQRRARKDFKKLRRDRD